MIPRSAPSGSTEWSGERPHRTRDGGALRPGRYISEHASCSFVNELESVATRIAEADPERAVGLYETFIAACYEKASEVDDSSGYLGMFSGSLFARWVTPLGRQSPPTRPTPWPGCLGGWRGTSMGSGRTLRRHRVGPRRGRAGGVCRPPQAPRRHRNGASVHPAPDRHSAPCCLHRPARCRRVHRVCGTIRPHRQGLPRVATILAAKDDPAAALTWTERGLRHRGQLRPPGEASRTADRARPP